MCSGRFVCLSVVTSVCRIFTVKVIRVVKLDSVTWSYQSQELINYWYVMIRSRMRIPEHFSTSIIIADLGDLCAFLTQSPAVFLRYWAK